MTMAGASALLSREWFWSAVAVYPPGTPAYFDGSETLFWGGTGRVVLGLYGVAEVRFIMGTTSRRLLLMRRKTTAETMKAMKATAATTPMMAHFEKLPLPLLPKGPLLLPFLSLPKDWRGRSSDEAGAIETKVK